jgi:hypothetical protein
MMITRLMGLHDHAAVVGDHLGRHRDVNRPDARVQTTHLQLPAAHGRRTRGGAVNKCKLGNKLRKREHCPPSWYCLRESKTKTENRRSIQARAICPLPGVCTCFLWKSLHERSGRALAVQNRGALDLTGSGCCTKAADGMSRQLSPRAPSHVCENSRQPFFVSPRWGERGGHDACMTSALPTFTTVP